MHLTEALERSQPGLFYRIQCAMSKHSLNRRTEQTYLHWISRFVYFHQSKAADALENKDQHLFLNYLSDRIQVSRARLNQAQHALTLFYADVLQKTDPDQQPHLSHYASKVDYPGRLRGPEGGDGTSLAG
ncbi:Phage integrase, N-terminal SAM-like domain [Marinobacter daqiaonensis]|uniref:Phage integrase, N-terminal SAM-like domain n=1 Tax=Marinobacter daqiaonensis TaxID=650891 RepID=A0A1I6I854_9GAMM|nr:phage integrase N-terminal SAM-like domain-containing protein [Marinobacter daqiaonensis]SFR62818.1 Phage integrase, N-terminal SAM-like domain [Marinobacter daqiaonensis]